MKKLYFLFLFISVTSFGQTQIGSDINGEAPNDNSGECISLSLDGNIIAIGAIGNDGNGNGSGHTRVYQNVSGVWIQIGNDINGENAGDSSGRSVSLSSDGSVIAIGAATNDGNGNNSGHTRVYQNVSGVWTQIGSDINGEAASDQFGMSVSLSSDGNIVAIGSPYNNGNGNGSGHTRVYQNVSGVWTQIGSDIDGEAAGDNTGWRVSLSSNGNIVAISSPNNNGNGIFSGHTRIYKNVSGLWIQIGNDINGEAITDFSGSYVSLSANGSIVAISSSFNNGNSGHVRVYDLSSILSSETYSLDNFTIYPNPSLNQITIHLQDNIEFQKASIYNTLGQLIKIETTKIINVSDLSKGTYFIEVITDKGKATKSFVKQ